MVFVTKAVRKSELRRELEGILRVKVVVERTAVVILRDGIKECRGRNAEQEIGKIVSGEELRREVKGDVIVGAVEPQGGYRLDVAENHGRFSGVTPFDPTRR